MTPRRVVVAMIEPPLPFGNAAGRWFYVLLKGLVERGHRVTAFAACGKPTEIDEARALVPAPAYDLRCYPSAGRRNRQRAAARALVERHCGPGPTLDAVEELYALVAGGRPP